MGKKNNYSDKTIMFQQTNTGRIMADAMDTYHWLLSQNNIMAKAFLKKINDVDKIFQEQREEGAIWKMEYKIDHEIEKAAAVALVDKVKKSKFWDKKHNLDYRKLNKKRKRIPLKNNNIIK